MSVIIRLQNLPWTANALDIRRFFQGLQIPDGGVHIVGGDNGDAFIAFGTDEDARRAMMQDGQSLNDTQIKLFLSSKAEMQNVIAVARSSTAVAHLGADIGYNIASESAIPMPFDSPGGGLAPYRHANGPGSPLSYRNISQQKDPFGNQTRHFDRSGEVGFLQESFLEENNGRAHPRLHPDQRPSSGMPFRNQHSVARLPSKGLRMNEPASPYWQKNAVNDSMQSKLHNFPSRPPFNLDQEPLYPREISDLDYEKDNYRMNDLPVPPLGSHKVGSRPLHYSSIRDKDTQIVPNSNLKRDAMKFVKRPLHEEGVAKVHSKELLNPAFEQLKKEKSFRSEEDDRYQGKQMASKGDRLVRYEPSRRVSDWRDYDRQDGKRHRSHSPPHNTGFSRERSPMNERQRNHSSRYDRGPSRRITRDGEKDRKHEELSRRYSRSRERRVEKEQKIYLFVSNLPDNVSYKDVRRFFSGCEIPRDGLKLINDVKGNRNGTAFVKFINERAASDALKLNGEFIGQSRLYLTYCTEIEFESSVDSYRPPDVVPQKDFDARLTSDQKGSTEQHYAPLHPTRRERLSDDHLSRSDGQAPRSAYPSGSASFVHRDSFEDQVPERFQKNRSTDGEQICILLKNMPLKVEREDIRTFFGHLNVAKSGIYIEYDNLGRSLGNAYVEFSTHRDYLEALRMHKRLLHGTQIHIFPISKEEKDKRVDNHRGYQREEKIKHFQRDSEVSPRSFRSRSPLHPKVAGRQSPSPRSRRSMARDSKSPPRTQTEPPRHDTELFKSNEGYHCVKMKGLPYSTGVQTITEFMGGIEIPDGGIHILCYPNGQATGTAYIEFMTTVDCQCALERDMKYIGKRYISVTPIHKEDMFREMKEFTEQPPPDLPPMLQAEFPEHGEPVEVRLQNVPYACKPYELTDFFRGFYPLPNSVQFVLHEDGKPTGKASVLLQNSKVALDAVKELNGNSIRGRRVSVHLA